MPTSGTHITVVEQVALQSPNLQQILGDPQADPDSLLGTRMRYAKLGSVGPDVLYMLADFNLSGASALEDLVSFLVKVAGSTACFSSLSERINKWLTKELDSISSGFATEIQDTSRRLGSTVNNAFLSLMVDSGVNILAIFRSPRQQDLPREQWFWADYLHYVKTGDFTKKLVENAKSRDENLYAYALGYLTHYVTDVVGHPYVNQVVQGPYRLHWQRHHLVENFIDAYVWDRWHTKNTSTPVGADEPLLDIPLVVPSGTIDKGAPITYARLHDHINIGVSSLGDPLDTIFTEVCKSIEKGLFDIGIIEKVDTAAPDVQAVKQWSSLLADTIKEVYPADSIHPRILAGPPSPRPDGYPSADDIASAYGILRLLLKTSTEENVTPPQFPDIAGDITDVINRIMDTVAKDIGGIPPLPVPNSDSTFSLEALIQAIADAAQWVAEVVESVARVVVDLVASAAAGAVEVIVTESIKVGLWLLNSALYALYQSFRQILVLNGYSSPYTKQLNSMIGCVNAQDLWISPGNLPTNNYPVEENPKARMTVFSPYRPYIAPAISNIFESPPVPFTAPYLAGSRPEAFLESIADLSPNDQTGQPSRNDMFGGIDFQIPVIVATDSDSRPLNFGGAVDNCQRAMETINQPGSNITLPNFDMDGDRGYGWPGWHVNPEPLIDRPAEAQDPLNPDPSNTFQVQRSIHVNAVITQD